MTEPEFVYEPVDQDEIITWKNNAEILKRAGTRTTADVLMEATKIICSEGWQGRLTPATHKQKDEELFEWLLCLWFEGDGDEIAETLEALDDDPIKTILTDKLHIIQLQQEVLVYVDETGAVQ